jgi:hypothetical protein
MRFFWSAVIGAAVGLGLGLLYAWYISPVRFIDTSPDTLSAQAKEDYIRLVARSFAVEGNIERARARLALLGEGDLTQPVTALAQQSAAAGADPQTVSALAQLAAALGARPAPPTLTTSSSAQVNAPTLTLTLEPTLTPEPTSTPIPTLTPFLLPTRTPTATPIGAFDFVGKQLVCDARLQLPLIQVIVLDNQGGEVPGVEVVVEWDGGFDHFFTGLKPELGEGYGDFAMTAGVAYTVHLVASPAAVVRDLAVEPCTDDAGRTFPGSWQLVFRQP